MSHYAVDEDHLIHVSDAETGKTYWCHECFGPVKKRRGGSCTFHFYHLKNGPSCRLFSRAQNHFLAQKQLQRLLPECELEKPFLHIVRVGDCVWEKEKVVFEIQCSPIQENEVLQRVSDYKSMGYDVIWLLDDQRYNKKTLRPAEKLLRAHSCYYLRIKETTLPICYDQFEIFEKDKRVRKGQEFSIDLRKILYTPQKELSPDLHPKQVLALRSNRYFYNDRLYRSLKKADSIPYWIELEKKIEKKQRWLRRFFQFLLKRIKIKIGMDQNRQKKPYKPRNQCQR